MVDLVKLRQKAKEKKEAESAEETQGDEPAAAAPKKQPAKRTRKKKSPARKSALKEPPAEIVAEAVETPPKEIPTEVAVEPVVDVVAEAVEVAPAQPEPAPEVVTDVAAAAPVSEETTEPTAAESTKTLEKEDEPRVADEALTVPDEPAEEAVEAAPTDRLARFKEEAGKRRTWTASTIQQTGGGVEEEESRDLELLRFRLSGEEYAVDIENIVEIVPPRATTRVPNATDTVVGIMSLRGTIVTVFDLCHKLGHPSREEKPGDDPRMIVVERAGETAGFLVDRVSRVVKLDPDRLESHPVVSAAEQSDWVGGVFQSSEGLVILLDLEKILASQS